MPGLPTRSKNIAPCQYETPRRLLLARVLAQDAPLLLVDEPAAGLDLSHQIGLMETLATLIRGGRGVLASLHDLSLAARWCDWLVLLDRGRVVADDAPAAVLTADRLATVYGVRAFATETADGLVLQPVARSRPSGRTRLPAPRLLRGGRPPRRPRAA